MQQANNSSENLVKLFNERQYQRVLDISTTNEINPSNNPNEAYSCSFTISNWKI